MIHGASGGIPRRINTLCNRLLLAGFLGEKHAFEVGDVQAIVTEISDEMGPDVSVGGAAARRLREADVVYDMPRARAIDGGGDWSSRLHTIESRIERLEKTMSTAVDLLNRALNRPAKPGSAKP